MLIICTNLGPSDRPRNLIIHEITTRSIHLTWQPPEYEFHNGVLEKYILTYQGELLNKTMSIMEFPLDTSNSSFLHHAELINLEENTTFTISITLFASGQMSPPATIVVRTHDAGKLF